MNEAEQFDTKRQSTCPPTLPELLKRQRAHRAALQAIEREIARHLEARYHQAKEADITDKLGANQVAGSEHLNDPTIFPDDDLFEQFAGLNRTVLDDITLDEPAPAHSAYIFSDCDPNEPLSSFDDLPPLLISPAQADYNRMRVFFEFVAEPGLESFCQTLRGESIAARLYRYRSAARVIAGTGEATCRFEVRVTGDEIRLTAARHLPQGNEPQITGRRGRGAYVTESFAERQYHFSDLNLLTPAMIAGIFIANFRQSR